jgi:chromosome segregation ATPase
MNKATSGSSPALPAESLPSGAVVRLEVRPVNGRPTVYEVGDGGFLVGSVPGCDLRLPGANLPPVLCLISRHANTASLRKLAPVQPITVNGRAISSVYLNNGDRITLASVEMSVSIVCGAEGKSPAARPTAAPVSVDPTAVLGDLAAREKALREQQEQLDAERALWARKCEEIEAECQRQKQLLQGVSQGLRQQVDTVETERSDLEERERALKQGVEEMARQRLELEKRGEEAARQEAEAAGLRKEVAKIREELYDRYRQRRDRLLKHQDAVRRAARKLQERKRRFETEVAEMTETRQQWEGQVAGLEAGREQLQRERQLLDDQHRLLASRQQELQRDLAERTSDLQGREEKLAEEQAALETGQKQHQNDLVRLDRIQAKMEQRQKQLQTQALEVDRRFEQLQRDSRDLEEQATQLDEWHQRMTAETEVLARQKNEQDAVVSQLDQRAAALESQQAMLATLRTRLERMREELRKQEEALSDQRALQDATENDLRERAEEAKQLREALVNDRQLHEEERKRFEERRTVMEAAVAQLRKTQEALAVEEADLREQQQQVEATAAEQTEQAGVLLARGTQLEDLQQRITTDRQAMQDREAALAKAEIAVSTLQEQLRRRSDELTERQKTLTEREQKSQQTETDLQARTRSVDEEQKLALERLEAVRHELADRSRALDELQQELLKREENLRIDRQRLEETTHALSGQRQALAAERIAWEVERQTAHEALAKARDDLDRARKGALELARLLPDLEARGTAGLERLLRARDQLREHLNEIHTYTRQSREDLELARKHVQSEAEQVRHKDLALHVARDEHRLAVAAFRQQLIEWQGQVSEMRQILQHDESRLDRKAAEVEQQAQQIADASAKLAEQAEQLQVREREVVERRGEVDRHLVDMRQWYRRKLRELAGIDMPERDASDEDGEAAVVPLPVKAGDDSGQPAADGDAQPGERNILSLTGDVDPGDRQLGDLLTSLELIDTDTLTALLLEARRQRRSLRQLLLAGNYLTLYQMALIEAGNLDALVLGPVRIIDRLQAGLHEAVYRVFDPRRNCEALLRHLAESEMADAVRPDEFRQRFAAVAAVQDAHLAGTLEVLDIAGRPAVLQEWLNGLPSADWPALTAAPGVWFRLVSQAAVALQTAHAAGLVHGNLHAGSFVFTREGQLKLLGLGEPRWLLEPPVAAEADPTLGGDLAALGRIAADWAANTPRKGSKPKPLPGELAAVLRRLQAEDAGSRYPSAAALLEDLERAGADVPANATAWDRFVREVKAQASALTLRRSA